MLDKKFLPCYNEENRQRAERGKDVFYLIFALSFILATFLSLWFARRKGTDLLDKIIKISTVAFIVFSLVDDFLPDLFMCAHSADFLETMGSTGFHALVRWFSLVCFVVLPIAVYRKNKYFERIASFFCLPAAIVKVICFYQYIEYFTANSNSGLQTVRIIPQEFKDLLVNEGFRSVFFGLTCLCQLTALVLLTYRNRKNLAVKKNEVVNLILIFIGVTYISLPIYVPQHLFGLSDMLISRFSLIHIIWMVGIVAIIAALYFIFKNKSYEARYLLVLALSWALMMQFNQMFTASSELNVMKLPLQLCNLGSYLALAMLLTKNEKIYHFALVVNVVGAVIAIVILDINKDFAHITNLWTVHYIAEHTKVLVVPILCLLLKIFKPIDLKSIKHFSIGFTVYYLFVFLLGTVSNGLYRMCEGKDIQNFFYANHLFMFDKEIAGNLVGFTDPLFENCVIKLGAFEIYPLVQVLVYIVFMAICLGVYFMIYLLSKKLRNQSSELT